MTRRIARIANCQNVSERRPQDEARLALTKPGKYGIPHIVLLSEISWLDLAALCDDLGWHSVQHGEKGSPEAGVGIAARVPLEPLGMLVGSKPTSEGVGGVRMRPILGAEVWGQPFWSIHAPPPDSPQAREEFTRRARCCRGVVAGDWNRDSDWMRANFARDYRGHGVLGLLAPSRLRSGKAETVAIASDHLAVDVPLHFR